MKYVQQYCLIDTTTPHIAAVNACTSACSPLGDVLETLWISSHPFLGQYDYCSENSSAYTNHAGDCARCLQGQEESVIIGNFVDTMNQACVSRPLAANDELLSPTRALFETSLPSSTDTSSTAASTSGSSAAATQTNSASISGSSAAQSTDETTEDDHTAKSSDSGGLSTGAVAGIGVGVAVLAIGVIAGLVFLFVRRRRTTKLAQSSTAAELPIDTRYNGMAQDVRHEKAAWGSEEQLHEAPSDTKSRFVELPAADR